MNRNQQRRLDKYERELAFIADNADVFTSASPGGKVAAAQTADIARIKQLAAEQASGAGGSRMQTGLKEDYLEEIIRLLRMIDRAADAVEGEIPGVDDMFRLPRSRGEQSLLTTARAFVRDAAPFKDKFKDYDVPESLFTRLTELVGLVENASSARDLSEVQSGSATGELRELFSRCGKRSQTLNVIVKNKFVTNPARLAAWAIASHLETASPAEAPAPQPA